MGDVRVGCGGLLVGGKVDWWAGFGCAEGAEGGEADACRADGGEGGAEHVVEVVGDLVRPADGVGGDGDAAAGVGFDDVHGVVPLEQGEAVPEEGFGVIEFRKLRLAAISVLNRFSRIFDVQSVLGENQIRSGLGMELQNSRYSDPLT